MDRPKSEISPELESFLAAILDRPDRDRAAAFAAKILGEHNFNPNEPRNRRGEWTTGGSYDAEYFDGLHGRTGRTGGGIAYQDGHAVGTDPNPYYPTARERDVILKYSRTITVFVGHSADVIKAAISAAAEINNTKGVHNAKIAGIACGGGSTDINTNLRSFDGVKDLVPHLGDLQELPAGVGRSTGFAGLGGAVSLPDIGDGLLRAEDQAAMEKKSLQGPPVIAKAEAINRAFVNSLVKEAIKMLPRCDGYVEFHIEQLPEGWNKAFTVKDVAKEAGIRNGTRENIFRHKVVWTLDGGDLIGEVF